MNLLPFWRCCKYVIALDEDVDIFNSADVFHSLTTRVNPDKDITIINETVGYPADISFPKILGIEYLDRVGGNVAIDATIPSGPGVPERENFMKINPSEWGKVSLQDFID